VYRDTQNSQATFRQQQAKPEVIRLIARINYALHSGTVRIINGIKVKDVDSFFNALDTDKKGSIGKEQLKTGLMKLKVNFPEESLALLMDQLDNDMSGTLVKRELLKWWEQIEVVVAAAKAEQDNRIQERAMSGENSASSAKGQRRIRSAASQVVAQLQFIFAGYHNRTLYGKPVTDPVSFFKALDQDGTGQIHASEITAGLKRLDVPVTDGDIQALVEMIDRDASGEMDIKEMVSWLEYQLVGASVAQQIRDCFEENRTLFGCPVSDAGSFFEACDLDGNGFLKYDEIAKGLKFMHTSVGYPEMDALLATMGKDRSSLITKEEIVWALDQKAQWARVKDNFH